MVRNGTQWQRRSVALQKSRSTLRGISPIANKMALGTNATASRRVRSERHYLHGARPDAMRDRTLMPSPLSTAPANAPGCTQRREGDSPSFFAATADRCGRVAHTPIATSRRYRRGSMWAGRPHSYGDRSPISLRIDCLVSASRSGKRLGSNAPNGASIKPKNSDAGSAPSELSDTSPAKPRPCT